MKLRRKSLLLQEKKQFYEIGSGIKYSTVKRVLEMEFGDFDQKMRINVRGPLSPLLGFIVHSLGVGYNMRMYSPGICPKRLDESVGYKRFYDGDEGVDKLHEMFVILLPSEEGILSAESNRNSSFFKAITKNGKSMGIRFSAALAVLSLGERLSCSESISEDEISIRISHSCLPEIKFSGCIADLSEMLSVLRYFSSPEEDKDEFIINKFLESREFLLQVFLFSFLNSEKEIWLFFDTLFQMLRKSQKILNECFVMSGHKTETNYKLVEGVINEMSKFPFSRLNPPPPNAMVPAFSRSSNKFLDEYFSDDMEISILKLLCCLFYDSSSLNYSTSHLEGYHSSENLKSFFRNSSFSFDLECRKDWIKVLEDLECPRIAYRKRCSGARNKIDTGLLNLIFVLDEICNLNIESELLSLDRRPSDILSKEREYSIICEFRKVINRIFCILNLDSNRNICIICNHIWIEKGIEGRMWDIFGDVEMIFSVKGSFKSEVRLTCSPSHASVDIETIFDAKLRKNDKEAATKLLKSGNALDFFIGKYQNILEYASGKRMRDLVEENIYNALLCRALCDDKDRAGILDIIYNSFKCSEDKIPTRARLMMSNMICGTHDLCKLHECERFLSISDNLFERYLATMSLRKGFELSIIGMVSFRDYDDINRNYLIKHCDRICSDEDILSDLICGMVFKRGYRSTPFFLCDEDIPKIFDIIEKTGLAKKYFRSLIHYFLYVMVGYNVSHTTPDNIKNSDVMKVTPCSCCQIALSRTLIFLKELTRSKNIINKEHLEKMYCWCLRCTIMINTCMVEILLEHTYENPALPIDIIYGWIVRHPNISDFSFYKLLLELTLRSNMDGRKSDGLKVRRDGFITIRHLAKSVSDKKDGVEVLKETYLLSQEVARLLKRIEENMLIYEEESFSFNEKEFMKLIDLYLVRDVYYHPSYESSEEYISNIDKLYGTDEWF